jgi:hypothetical protein
MDGIKNLTTQPPESNGQIILKFIVQSIRI